MRRAFFGGLFLATLFSLLPLSASAGQVAEVEPNNKPEQATPIQVGDTVSGKIQHFDIDLFQLTLPESGIVTLNLSGFPPDCKLRVDGSGFYYQSSLTNPVGGVVSEPGQPVTFSFSAQGKQKGLIRVEMSDPKGGLCSGSDWCATQCSSNGPYYLLPFIDRPSKNVPPSYSGKPVLPPIQYQFQVALQALPDPYEPNYQEGMAKEALLQKGLIKTIPLGKEITAYLFNEYPQPMRGTKGYENSTILGGENDVDVYHVRLDRPETVKVNLRDFPPNLNSRIMIYDGQGWDESKTGAASFERKVAKHGDVFIEISRGRGNGQLAFSKTPYKLRVTAGAAVIAPWAEIIRSGKPFKVVFDVAPTKFNDEGWLGANDPMGTLKGGETYTVQLNPSTQEWKVTGFNEGTGGVGTWTYQGASPDNCQLNLWGRVYLFTPEGKVIDQDYGWVGHLQE
jgi:hypothetical protein